MPNTTRSEYHHNYYEAHKDAYKKFYQDNQHFLKEKYTCECGKTLTTAKRTRHLKTLFHQHWEASQALKENGQ